MSEAISVTRLVRQLKNLLEIQVGEVWVTGEISNLRKQASGHFYFTLKDDKAQITCAMFKGAASKLKEPLQDGKKVKLFAETTIYEAQGKMQLIVRKLESAGQGNLHERFEALKAKLFQAGYFSQEHKKGLPRFPKRIGLVTSPTGAALQDMLQIFKRRWSHVEFYLIGVRVQGEGAEHEVVKAIQQFNQYENYDLPRMDLMIVGRGGGSIEDLWAFNEESVAMAVYESEIPVVSAVGHEIDHTIIDFVSDLRAPTPSAAAELSVPNREELLSELSQKRHYLNEAVQSKISNHHSNLKNLTQTLKQLPKRIVEQKAQLLDHSSERLVQVTKGQLRVKRQRLEILKQRFQELSPQLIMLKQRQLLEQQQQKLKGVAEQRLFELKEKLGACAQVLKALDPQNVLDRGYSITTDLSGNVLSNPSKVKAGAILHTQLKEGELTSVVRKNGNQAELF